MLGLLVGYLRTLQVLVGYTDIRMPCLVACYDDSLGIGEVSDTRVLQAIELVGFGKEASRTLFHSTRNLFT